MRGRMLMIDNLEALVSDSRLAFIQGRYDETLKLAKQAIELYNRQSNSYPCGHNRFDYVR